MGVSSGALDSFDSLVAGIGSDERQNLLQKLRRSGNNLSRPMNVAREEVHDTQSLRKRLQSEGVFYRILLWFRATFTGQRQEDIYNRDLLGNLSRSITLGHPGIMDGQRRLLLTGFLDRLEAIKDCAEFFKPYIDKVTDRRGEFYVFVSTLVAPEIADTIDQDADPYSLPLDQTIASDTKSSLLHKLNDTLMNVNDTAKQNMRSSVMCFEWMRQFSVMRFEHFIGQFTQAGRSASCMFNSAKTDYAEVARVLSNAVTISDKVLDALFLFSQTKRGEAVADDTSEKELQAFMFKAAAKLQAVQAFVSGIPVVALGRVMWASYDWNPATFGGGEDWRQVFRAQWREIFDERWNAWMADRKRKEVENMLIDMFEIEQFPVLKHRPWQNMRGVNFRCEMTAGFIVWFCENEWPLVSPSMKALMMEGIFINSANQSEYSITTNELGDIMRRAREFSKSVSDGGELSTTLSHLAAERMNTINWQSKITGVMMTAEAVVHDMSTDLCNQCRVIERVLHGVFDEDIAGGYDTIRNLNTIKGGDNKEFRDGLNRARKSLGGARQILSELEVLDAPAKADGKTEKTGKAEGK